MNTISKIALISIICYLIGVLHPTKLFAQQNSSASAITEQRDGQHDFDYNIGKWKTHIARLQNPLSGTKTWIKMEGTVTTTKLWGGRAQIEQIEADGPSGHWEGMTLFLYNPQSHQWSQTFAGGASGVLEPAIIGEFKNGRGEFFGQDTFNGRSILTRGIWSDITPNTHKFEQAFSEDGGKTWETNFIATLERIN